MANLPQRAREATGLTQRDFAELINVRQPQVARWERSPRSITAAARTLLTLIEADAAHAKKILLRSQDGITTGFTGDGGPPPNQQRQPTEHEEDAVPGYTPDFGYVGPQEEPGFDPGASGAPVPDYSPEMP